MKSSKVIIFVLAIAMIAMGAGYAAWTQNFTVTAQVDTGQLSVLVGDFGTSTTIRSMGILGSEGQLLKSNSGYNGDVQEQVDGSKVYTPLASDKLDYADVNLLMPADRESVILNVMDAYPGLLYAIDVRMVNEGTIPAVLSDTEPVSFVGIGPNKALADDLITNGHVSFEVKPNSTGNPLGKELGVGHMVPLDIEMKINSSLPENVEVRGVTYDLESKDGSIPVILSYELIYNVKQYNK